MKQQSIFKTLILLARPAAGKSEIIHYLNQIHSEVRKNKFHLGQLFVLDDFPMIWSWFEEDDILAKMGLPRIHTDKHGYFLLNEYWNLLIERINLEYLKHEKNCSNQERAQETVVIEFSRGLEHGGYKAAFSHLSDAIITSLAILYINVSWEESLRKNRKRFNPDKPDSILEHGLTDDKMRRLYYETDWDEISSTDANYVIVRNTKIPYQVFENEDDVTSGNAQGLDEILQSSLGLLWNKNIKNLIK